MEVLVYCVVAALSCALLFKYTTTANLGLSGLNAYAHDYGMLLAAHDVCVRDIQSGSNDAQQWYDEDDQMVIWQVGHEARGWWSGLITIERVVGMFDFEKKTWSNATKGLVAQIDEADIGLELIEDDARGKITYVDFTISGVSKKRTLEIASSAAPRNRII